MAGVLRAHSGTVNLIQTQLCILEEELDEATPKLSSLPTAPQIWTRGGRTSGENPVLLRTEKGKEKICIQA